MILAIFLAFTQLTSFGRRLEIPKKKTRQLSTEPSWYFIHILDGFNIKDYNDTFDITTFVTKEWYRVFLTPNKRIELENTGLVELREITSEEKIIKTDISLEEAKFLLVETESNFIPIESSKMKWTQLSNQIYQVECFNKEEIAKELSLNKQIVTISGSKGIEINNRFAGGRLQGNIEPTIEEGIFQTHKPFLKKGINGDGEIITIYDTGLDMKSTYFYDSKHPYFQYNQLQPEQRKVILYNTKYGDHFDKNGHGTHVAGIASGKSSCQNCNAELYDGIAPNAKIVFYDGTSGNETGIRIPYLKEILDEMRKVKSNILSCSWGSNKENILFSNIYDSFMYKYQDILAIFAAGNEGIKIVNQKMRNNLYSIGSPGTSKNVLTVGNMLSPYSLSFETDPGAINMQGDALFKINSNIKVNVAEWSKNSMRINFDPTIKGNLVEPEESNFDDIVYINSNHCYELSNLLIIPKAVILGNYKYDSCMNVDFPVLYTTNDLSYLLGTQITISPSLSDYHKESMIQSSSRGPTSSGLLKPDISGVGALVISAKSTIYPDIIPHENLIGKVGTSMATPLIAGTIALIDQYFKNKNIKPDASLLKALLISSADPVPKYSRTPDAHSGHGIPNIQNILRDTTNIAQNVNIKNHQHLVAKILVVDTNEPLRIGMSYLDYPTNTESIFYNLVADLDLYVKDPKGNIIYGNMHPRNIEEHFSTNEKVIIEKHNLMIGKYEIHIVNEQISELPYGEIIKFSACAVGQIMKGSLIFNEATISETSETCSNHGYYNYDNTCICDKGYVGINCQIEEYNLNEEEIMIDMAPSGLAYFNLTLPEHFTKVNILMNKEIGEYQESFKLYYSINEPKRIIGSNDGLWLMNGQNYLTFNKQITPKDFLGGTILHFIALNNYPEKNTLSVQVKINENYYFWNAKTTGKVLQSGKTIGIVISCVSVVTIVVVVIIFIIKKNRKHSNEDINIEEEFETHDQI